MLEVKNLTVYYDKVQALDAVSLHVADGEIIALIGPNGAGKSTALKAISGILNPQTGDIYFDGQRINGLQPYQLVPGGLCLVPEGRHVFPSMTVQENLEMGAFTQPDKQVNETNLKRVYQLFPRLQERQIQKAGTLSSGEQQMLAIGRALMLNPKLLLVDEPSVGLSPNFIESVFDIDRIAMEGKTESLLEDISVQKTYLGIA